MASVKLGQERHRDSRVLVDCNAAEVPVVFF